jgi:hypothetical protein
MIEYNTTYLFLPRFHLQTHYDNIIFSSAVRLWVHAVKENMKKENTKSSSSLVLLPKGEGKRKIPENIFFPDAFFSYSFSSSWGEEIQR